MMLNFLVAMSQTTAENGATRVVPDTHLTDYSVQGELAEDGTMPESWRDDKAVAVPLDAGDCLLV